MSRLPLISALLLSIVLPLSASDVVGTVIVRHRLTRKKVTPAVDGYSRGITVPLDTPSSSDTLSYERSHVVLYIEDGAPSKKPVSPLTMEQKNRAFSPDLVVVPVGGSVTFPNLDPIFHNVFSLSKVKNFDLGNYPKGQTRTVEFARAGVAMVNCHLHPNMTAAVMVTPNEHFTRADAQGNFSLKDIPPGKHTVVAWHKAAGFFRQTINVEAGKDVAITFDVPLDEHGALIQRTSSR